MRANMISMIGLLTLVACSGGGDKDDPGDGTKSDTGQPDTDTSTGETDTAIGDDDDDDDVPPLAEECDPTQAPFNDQAGNPIATYDCTQLDQCEETDIAYFTACCNCDPYYCNEPSPPCEDVVLPTQTATSCMQCHNGSDYDDYQGPGLSNPHPFGGANYISCTVCHGGNGEGAGKFDSHVPVPPWIGDDQQLVNDAQSYFNFLTLTGIDKQQPQTYTVDGVSYTALEWLQFRNPGDLRVISEGQSCGTSGCHAGEHADWVPKSILATEAGFYSASMYTSGIDNYYADRRSATWYQYTASDYAFRSVEDPNFVFDPANVGAVPSLTEFPEHALYGDQGSIYGSAVYDANILAGMVYQDFEENGQRTNSVKAGTPLSDLIRETITFQCGDCHLGSAGANNRYADFRSSGCTSCHMQYARDGRSNSTDPNVDKYEPFNPDAIAAPERPHIDAHQIRNVAKILPGGSFVRGIDDYACVGCHQGSNRTVLQYWGIRLDQNQDVTNNFQYPANPQDFENTAADTRLYDPAVQNNTFNGRIAEQYLLFEDYDGDGRDDTPEDIHYERGLACIDCHGSRDLHNGQEGDATSGRIQSREDQSVKVECESCHGDETGYAYTAPCEDYLGNTVTCATDRVGNPLRNVTYDAATGEFWLISRLDGSRHYVPQTLDVIVDNNVVNQTTGQEVYTAIGSYAMGRADGTFGTGTGPLQADPNLYTQGFSHMDSLDCTSCHSSWQNNCVGCHLDGFHDDNPQNFFFNNTTGNRQGFFANANFTYQNPVLFTLMVGSRNLVTEGQSGMKMFFRYTDYNNNTSDTQAFTDVNGNGNNPTAPRGAFGALAHNRIRAHSTRGKIDTFNEGPRYCNACHLTQNAIDNFGDDYAVFFNAYIDRDYATIDNEIGLANLANFIGQNTNNQDDNPYYVHMAAGLGTALFLFDANGCPVNPVDNNADRFYCEGEAPANIFDINNVAYDLDRIVENTGVQNSSTTHPMLEATFTQLRSGALQPNISGPLGATMLSKLADPNFAVILDSWIDSDGAPQGDAANFLVY